MRALVADRSAPSGVSDTEAPDPEPGRDQALIEVRAVSLNRGEAGRLEPQIGLTGSLWEPEEALAALPDREVAGKAVLVTAA
jgi:NADPH:quinone reductase-like Zn-dependent oxidoreductase